MCNLTTLSDCAKNDTSQSEKLNFSPSAYTTQFQCSIHCIVNFGKRATSIWNYAERKSKQTIEDLTMFKYRRQIECLDGFWDIQPFSQSTSWEASHDVECTIGFIFWRSSILWARFGVFGEIPRLFRTRRDKIETSRDRRKVGMAPSFLD